MVKRTVDLVVASLLIVLTAPIQSFLALVVRSQLGKPVLFRQQRPGKDERPFDVLKFRTMHNPDPADGPETDEKRITRTGSVMRSLSLDELPSLWNVLRGDMSLVGPRPLLMQYLDRYSDEQRRRHEVRPGITGLAQVSGRNAISWSEKFDLDIEYVETRSLLLDIRILLRTIGKVAARDGISDGASVTAKEFMGDRE